MDFCNLKLTLTLMMLLIKCRDSKDVDVTTIRSCEWLLYGNHLECNIYYAGHRSNASSSIIGGSVERPSASTADDLSPPSESDVGVCQLANTTELAEQSPKVRSLRVDCQVEAVVRRFLVMDAGTFKTFFVNVEQILIENIPLKNTFPRGAFCDLPPKLKYLQFLTESIADMDHLGLCTWSNCGSSSANLETLIVALNAMTSIRELSPLSCMTNLKHLSLFGNRLTEIHPGAFVNLFNLERLDLSKNALATLANGTLGSQKKLEWLSLAGNRFSGVPMIIVDHLKHLHLQDNQLTFLNNETFAGMAASLLTLHLSNNSLSFIDIGPFASMKELLQLFLDANNLTQVPCLEPLVKLEYLNLSKNAIASLEPDGAMLALTFMKKLYVADNLLTRLTSETLRKQRDLKVLHLMNNRISEIDEKAFAMIKALEELYLGGNRLTSVPNWQGLSQLQDLRLNDNHIDEVSRDSFVHLVSLRTLKLNGNRLHTLSDNLFVDLSKLRDLDMSNNEIISISNDTFAGLVDLQTIVLSGNKMAAFQSLWFPPSLLELNLSRNSIEEMNGQPSDRLQSLIVLDLSHNAIDSIELKSLPKRLEHLALNDNRISRLKSRVFKHMTKLRFIALQRNQIRSLDILSTYINDKIKWPVSFCLLDNPLLCDCKLDWILTNHNGRSFEVIDFQNLTCELGFKKSKADVLMDYDKLGNKTNASSDAALVATTSEEDFLCKHRTRGQSDDDEHANQLCTRYYKAEGVGGTIDCSERNFNSIPAFLHVDTNNHVLWETEVLYLDNNRISRLRIELHRFKSLKRLFLNNNVIEGLDKRSFHGLTKLQLLRMDHNLLPQLPSCCQGLFGDLKNLLTLDLSHNLLTNLSTSLFDPLTSLQSLKLNDNLLVDYPVWMLPAASEIGLQSNPWSCDCDYAGQYRKWIQSFRGKLTDMENLYCVENNRPSVSLITFNISECYEGTESTVLVFVPPGWLSKAWMAGFPAFLIVVSILIFVYRQEMQVLIYSRYRWRLFTEANDLHDADKLYDAFLSYSTADEDFVLGELLPGLENIENPYCLCLHHRDFPIGAFINESIFNSISTSRRSILILSENYVNSNWCRFEFRAAHSQMLQDKCKRVIVVVLGKIPEQLLDDEMKLYLRTYTYLVWGDRLFWKKLYFALPDARRIQHHLVSQAQGTIEMM